MILAAALLGTVPGWLTVGAVASLGYLVVRGGGGQALSILRDSNRTLAEKVEDLTQERSENAARITELERTRTLEPIISEIAGLSKSFERIIAAHEQRAQERHDSQIAAMNAIVDRLGGLADTLGGDHHAA